MDIAKEYYPFINLFAKESWYWQLKDHLGKLSVLYGPPHTGKTSMACSLAAMASTGQVYEEGNQGEPVSVLMCNSQHSIKDVIVPLISEFNANMENIKCSDIRLNDKNEVPEDVQEYVSNLKQAIEATKNCKIVIIDPMTRKRGDVLTELSVMASDLGIAIMIVAPSEESELSGSPDDIHSAISLTYYLFGDPPRPNAQSLNYTQLLFFNSYSYDAEGNRTVEHISTSLKKGE